MSVEMIGSYKVTPLKDGNYSVSLTNGNAGAFVTDKEGLEAFRAKYDKKQDTVDISQKKSSKPKKIAKSIASAYVSGLGQILDDRWKDGFKDFAKTYGFAGIGIAIGLAGYKNFLNAIAFNKTPYGFYAAIAGSLVFTALTLKSWVHSIVDAYKKG